MKHHSLLPATAIVAIVAAAAPAVHAQQTPALVPYQGRVQTGSPAADFNGTGQFRFALMQGTTGTRLWVNNGPTSGNPVNAVSLTVTNGLYSVMLGDTSIANMAAIPPSVFTVPDLRLRVWFNGTQLSPDQRLAPNGFLPSGTQIVAGPGVMPTTNGLHVTNPANTASQHAILSARVGGSAAGNPFLSLDVANESGWALGIDNADANKLKFSNAWDNLALAKMTLDTAGNVGIGTTAPVDRLQVLGGNLRIGSTVDVPISQSLLLTSSSVQAQILGGNSLNSNDLTLASGGVNSSVIINAGTDSGTINLNAWAFRFGPPGWDALLSASFGGMDFGNYSRAADSYFQIKTAGGNAWKSGLKLRHFSENYGWTLQSDESKYAFELRSHANDLNGSVVLEAGANSSRIVNIPGALSVGMPEGSTTGPISRLVVADGFIDGTSFTITPHYNFATYRANNVTLDIPGTDGILAIWDNLEVSSNTYVHGTIYKNEGGTWRSLLNNGGANQWAYWGSSDARLKKDIAPLTHALDTLAKLRGVTYDWNDAGLAHLTRDIEETWKSTSGTAADNEKLWAEKRAEAEKVLRQRQTGFIAQELEKVFPAWVRTDDRGYKQIDTHNMAAVLVQGINELAAQSKNQAAALTALQKENAALKAELAAQAAKDKAQDDKLAALTALVEKSSSAAATTASVSTAASKR